MDDEERARTAVFYSISSTQRGLKSIDLGRPTARSVIKSSSSRPWVAVGVCCDEVERVGWRRCARGLGCSARAGRRTIMSRTHACSVGVVSRLSFGCILYVACCIVAAWCVVPGAGCTESRGRAVPYQARRRRAQARAARPHNLCHSLADPRCTSVCHICTGTGLTPHPTSAPGLGSPQPTSAPRLGSPQPTSAPGLGSPPTHICTGTDPCHICTAIGLTTVVTFLPILQRTRRVPYRTLAVWRTAVSPYRT